MQFRVLGKARLQKERGLGGVEADRQPVRNHLPDIGLQIACLRVIGGQHVPVGHEVVALIFALQLHPILERAHQVTQMKLARGPHAAQDPPSGSGACSELLRGRFPGERSFHLLLRLQFVGDSSFGHAMLSENTFLARRATNE